MSTTQSEGALTASSTLPNSSNLDRSVPSSVCHARPLILLVALDFWSVTHPMKTLDMMRDEGR